jgi:hypothetical protein
MNCTKEAKKHNMSVNTADIKVQLSGRLLALHVQKALQSITFRHCRKAGTSKNSLDKRKIGIKITSWYILA